MRRFIYAVIHINNNQVKQKQTRKFFQRQF